MRFLLMPLTAMTAKAIPATTSAPSMNQRVLRRIFSDSVMPSVMASVMAQLLLFAQPQPQPHAIDGKPDRGQRIRGDDESPPSDDHSSGHASSPASSPAIGGIASSRARR